MIGNVQLGTSETTIKAAGVAETLAVLSLVLCNTDTADHTVTIYAYPTGGSAGALSTVLKDLTIPAGDSFVWSANEKLILGPSDKISGLADTASKVSVLVNYMEI